MYFTPALRGRLIRVPLNANAGRLEPQQSLPLVFDRCSPALARIARHGLPMLNIARHFLKEQQTEELHRLREDRPKRKKPLPRFLKWLRERNLRLSSLWKFHRRFLFQQAQNQCHTALAVQRWIASSLPVVSIPSSCQIMAYGWRNFQGEQYIRMQTYIRRQPAAAP
jgi:hypothetical protein